MRKSLLNILAILLTVVLSSFPSLAIDRTTMELPSGFFTGARWPYTTPKQEFKIIDNKLYAGTPAGLIVLEEYTSNSSDSWKTVAFEGKNVGRFHKNGDKFIAVINDTTNTHLEVEEVGSGVSVILNNTPTSIFEMQGHTSNPSRLSLLNNIGRDTDGYISDDFGATWQKQDCLYSGEKLLMSPTDGQTILSYEPFQVLTLCDWSWFYINFNCEDHFQADGRYPCACFVPTEDGERILICGKNQLFISEDKGATFKEINITGQLGHNVWITNLAVHPDNHNIVYGFEQYDELLYKWFKPTPQGTLSNEKKYRYVVSLDGGLTWADLFETDNNEIYMDYLICWGDKLMSVVNSKIIVYTIPDEMLTGITDVNADFYNDFKVTIDGKIARIRGAAPGSKVSAFTTVGQSITSVKADSQGGAILDLGSYRGIAVVSDGKSSTKIVVTD